MSKSPNTGNSWPASTKWRMVEPNPLFPSHVQVTQARERKVDGVMQRIERVMVQSTDAYEYPGWRVLEDGTILRVFGYLKDARTYCDRRVRVEFR